jgi:hypothetical protein
MNPTEEDVVPAWQQWLLAERPHLSHFLVGAVALLLPATAGIFGPDGILPAMGVAAVMGGGLGVGWTLACGWRWLKQSPVMAVGVLAMSLGCLGHLAVMPRWEALLRANAAITDARAWVQDSPENRPTLPPTYASGDGPIRFAAVDSAADTPQAIVLYTPQALTRWSPLGRVESCFIVIRRDGSAQVLRTSADRDAVLAGQPITP